MANKTIPQLGQVTAATSLDYLVITDSGETTTSKITKADFIAGVDTAGLVSGTGSNSMKSNDDLTANPSTAQYSYSIVLGDNATDTGGAGGIAIGRDSQAGGNVRTGVAIGYNTQANGNGTYVGWNGTANGDGAQAFGLQNTASQESSVALGVLVSNTGKHAVGIGRSSSVNAQRGVSIGWNNNITGGNSTGTNAYGSAILAGHAHSISSTGQMNTIIGGESNQITGTTSGATIVGMISHTYTPYDDTAYVENIHIIGTESKNTITGQTATGAVSVDLSTGSVFEFEMTGNITSITFTNWREGGMYEFVVFNNGSHTITSSGVRLDGVANTIAAKAGSINPTNNERTLYRMIIVNGKGYLNEHLNFQFM